MKDKYPKAWADFEKHYRDLYHTDNGILDWNNFTAMPFEMKLGVYLQYLDEKKLIIVNVYPYKLYDFTKSLKKAIEQAFKIREKQLCESK